jgi:hypothetical protein
VTTPEAIRASPTERILLVVSSGLFGFRIYDVAEAAGRAIDWNENVVLIW